MLSGGGGGVTGGRFGSIRTGWSCGVAECLADPSRVVWSAIGSLQEVAEVENVVHRPIAQGGSVLCRYVQGVAQTACAHVELVEGGIHARRELLYGEPEVRREVSVLKY